MVLGLAEKGGFTPLWSDFILDEWAHVTRKLGPTGEAQTRAEIALLKARFPKNAVVWPPSLNTQLWLPDPGDIHVLAAAIAGSADLILTLNAADFPRKVLAEEDLTRSDPDSFLCGFAQHQPELLRRIADQLLTKAQQNLGPHWTRRKLLKKAGLYRLAKMLET